jgi:hypothetical protein
MGKDYAALQRGGRLSVGGGGGSLRNHSAGSVTNQRKAFKYVMASEPYRYIQVQVCHTLRFTFCKTLIALKLKSL